MPEPGTVCSHHETHDCPVLESLEAAVRQSLNLERALLTSRTIGTAIGILVERHKVSGEAAFEVLAGVSQHTNRKVHEVASDLVFTGELPRLSRPRRHRRSA